MFETDCGIASAVSVKFIQLLKVPTKEVIEFGRAGIFSKPDSSNVWYRFVIEAGISGKFTRLLQPLKLCVRVVIEFGIFGIVTRLPQFIKVWYNTYRRKEGYKWQK